MLTDKYLRLQATYFRLLGFNIFAYSGSWVYPHRTIYCILSVLTFMPLTMAFCLQNVQNVDRLTDGLCSILIGLLGMSKFILVFWIHKDFKQLIDGTQCILIHESRVRTYVEIIERVNSREQFISRLYKNCFQLASASACLLPLIRLMSSFIRPDLVEALEQPEMPFPSVYPWDNRRVLNYLASYVWNVSATLGVLMPTICVDTLFFSLTLNLCGLFQIAQYKMQHFVGETLKETQSNLADVISLYQNILNICDTLNRYFRPLITVQLFVASLHLCVLGYQISENLTQLDGLYYVFFTFSILTQVGLYCYCGECVRTENENFANAIYESDWYEKECSWSKIGRPLQISLIRAQKGCRLHGYFFTANMATFLSIIKTAMSYVTMLQSIS